MAFKISGLKREPFQHLFELNDDELTGLGAKLSEKGRIPKREAQE